jgi:membrane protein YdbS with pleckstrin-like domain
VSQSGTERDPERGETPFQRSDRNWDELLSELRVTQTGVAILFSVLLTVPFSARFEDVDRFGRAVYLTALLFAASSAVVLIAPVAYHRLLFHRRQKPHIVAVSNRLALFGLGLLSMAVTAVLLLVSDVLIPRAAAVALTAGFGLSTLALWFVPALVRRRRKRLEHEDEQEAS